MTHSAESLASDMKAKTDHLRELRLHREHEAIDRLIAAEVEIAAMRQSNAEERARFLAAEAVSVNGQRLMTYANSLPPGWGFHDTYGMGGLNLSAQTTIQELDQGAQPPLFRTEADLEQTRNMARIATSAHCPGVGVLENLQSYVLGPGFTYTASNRKGVRPPDGLTHAVQMVVDQFLDTHNWNGDLDRELLGRTVVDGEFIVAVGGDASGKATLEILEPECLHDCGRWAEVESAYDYETNFTFGVHTHSQKPDKPLGYSVRRSSGQYAYYPASRVVHCKRNVRRRAKRGVSDFFPAWQWLEQQARLLTNVAAGAAELSAIAYIVRAAAGVGEERVRAMISQKADYQFQYGNKTIYKEWKPPGSVLVTGGSTEYEPGPSGHERGNAFLGIVQGILRVVATRWGMSEGMISGDDSNNSFASSITAGSRFHRYALARQSSLATVFKEIIWKALQVSYQSGVFSRYGFAPHMDGTWGRFQHLVEIAVDVPDVDVLSKMETETINDMRLKNGAMSLKTYRGKASLDDDVESKQIADEKKSGESPKEDADAGKQPAPSSPAAKVAMPVARPVHESAAGGYEYGCLMAILEPSDATAVRQLADRIDPQDLAGDGVESEPHCTVLYGFVQDEPEPILRSLALQRPLAITLGHLSVFAGTDHDVLKLDVGSPEVVALNAEMRATHPHVMAHPVYVPHVTVAYLKPGAGAKYAGESPLSGRTVVVRSLVHSPAVGDRVVIPLSGMAEERLKSEAQRRWMHATHPDMAKQWEKETPRHAELPERVTEGAVPVVPGDIPEASSHVSNGHQNLDVADDQECLCRCGMEQGVVDGAASEEAVGRRELGAEAGGQSVGGVPGDVRTATARRLSEGDCLGGGGDLIDAATRAMESATIQEALSRFREVYP